MRVKVTMMFIGNDDYFVTKRNKYLVLKINRTLKRVNRAEARGKYFLLFCQAKYLLFIRIQK